MAGRQEAPVQIKVLRLSRPRLHNESPVDGPGLPTRELVLPKMPHAVYVGEETGLLVSVNNAFDEDVSVQITAEIASPLGSKLVVAGSGEVPVTLGVDGSWTRLIKFEPLETGGHSLGVIVRYETGEEARSVRKAFRFEASQAISVRTKTSRVATGSPGRILETQVENLTDFALTIESCVLSPANDWSVQGVDAGCVFLKPRDVYQWCFCMDNGTTHDAGQVSVGWRREPLGVRGYQTTGMIQV